MNRFLLRLQRMLERKSHIYWNKWYFSNYIDDQMSPWGLRIQIFPTINKLEPEFKLQTKFTDVLCQNDGAVMLSLYQ